MKNFTKNQSMIFQFDKKNWNIWNNKVVLIILTQFFLIFYGNIMAQGSNNSDDIKEINSFLTTLKSTSMSGYEKLDLLTSGSNPTIYIKNNTLKTFGENCTVLSSDITSLSYIKNNAIESNNVEIVRISIKNATDINGKIDISFFSNFPNLKYIYIISSVNTTKQNIVNMIVNNKNEYSLLYKIDPAE